MPQRICFMHVGTGKTGSSALQYVLARTRADLEQRGYRFADFGRGFRRMDDGQATGGNASPIKQALRRRDVSTALDLMRPLAERPDHVILSNEGLYRVQPRMMNEFCEGLRTIGFQ